MKENHASLVQTSLNINSSNKKNIDGNFLVATSDNFEKEHTINIKED